MQHCCILVFLCLSWFLVGCGSDSVQLGSVEGTVSYKGTPLKSGTITFIPDKARIATGKIADGQILAVTTFEANDGAPVGPCKVTITSYADAAEGSTAPSRSSIPAKYADPTKSEQTVNIAPGKNVLTFDLK
jgi:hypothetical protein